MADAKCRKRAKLGITEPSCSYHLKNIAEKLCTAFRLMEVNSFIIKCKIDKKKVCLIFNLKKQLTQISSFINFSKQEAIVLGINRTYILSSLFFQSDCFQTVEFDP